LERITGKTSAEVLGKTDAEIYSNPEIGKAILENDYRIMASGKPETVEEIAETPDGRRLFISEKSPRFDKKGQVIGIIGISHDITERNKAEQALKRSEEHYHSLFVNMEEGFSFNKVVYDEVGKAIDFVILEANKAFEDSTGLKRKKVVGKRLSEAYPRVYEDLGAQNLLRLFAKVAETGKSARFEQYSHSMDKWLVGIVYSPTKGYFAVLNEDVTQRKLTEKKLEEYRNNLEKLVEERTKKLERSLLYARSLIEASLDPLVTINAEGKITDVNKATELATGCSRGELIGSDFSDYFTSPEKAKIGYRRVFIEGFVRDYELAIRHQSGKITNVLYNATVYRNEAGEVQGVFAAARDITELRKAEEQAQESAKKLKDAERLAAIGATAGMVGHDIRNPLQAIASDVYLAKTELASTLESDEKKSALESLTEIEKNVDYINKIVADLQDFARPLNPHAEETDLKLIIDELLKKNGLPENVKVSVKVESKARKVVADSSYINRIMYNLVNNAVQAMPKGGKLTIHVFKEADDSIITVKDTGVGIPESVQGKLFTPMFTTKSKGQGFGLAVVKRMTEALGGTVIFESQEGKGTAFIIRLPTPQR
jgi:PAS domain S-box-containing protein